MLERPRPPEHLFSSELTGEGAAFVPAPDLIDWAYTTFIDEGGPLENIDHQHLRSARIGALWTSVANSRQGRDIVGLAEIGKPQASMGKWARARIEQQITAWFGLVPDFILTFSAPFMEAASDATFCAVVEHELMHCGQDRDGFGMPKFHRDSGLPIFAMRGHDVEEFIGVARRYGSAAPGIAALMEAVTSGPAVAAADIGHACGNCAR